MIKARLLSLIAVKAQEENRRVKLSDIAQETGINPSTLSRMSQGKQLAWKVKDIDALCNYFRCGVGDLLEHTPTDPSQQEHHPPVKPRKPRQKEKRMV
jgi:putative transcriptional regulator